MGKKKSRHQKEPCHHMIAVGCRRYSNKATNPEPNMCPSCYRKMQDLSPKKFKKFLHERSNNCVCT